MFVCLECGRKFATDKAARRAAERGCPRCNGVDIDLDPNTPKVIAKIKKAPIKINPTDLLNDAKFDDFVAAARNGTEFTI